MKMKARKKIRIHNIRKLEYNFLNEKVDLSVIHPAHIIIHSF